MVRILIAGTAIAFAMFTVLPVRAPEWNEKNMRYMLAALPLVGIFLAGLCVLWQYLCSLFGFGSFLYGTGLLLIPLFLTGGIHMDGFCDTVDAISSRAAPEKKREILKDSHAGAFAIIFCAAYMIAYTAFAAELEFTWKAALFIGIEHVLSRAVGGFASAAFPSSSKTGLQYTFRSSASDSVAVITAVWAVLCMAGMIILYPFAGVLTSLSAVLCLVYLYFMSKKQFGGMSGDLAGFVIMLSEGVMLMVFVTAQRAVSLWF